MDPNPAGSKWKIIQLLRRYHNVALFLGGFIFDAVTIVRIDSWLDIMLQFVYLLALTIILVLQYRESKDAWRPKRFFSRIWRYNVEVLHFLYGGLLSAYTILYFKSSSGSRPIVFFLLIVILLIVNEMPQIRKYGHRLRLGLYAFCLASYMIYLVPILVGSMGPFVFVLSLALAGIMVWIVAGILARGTEDAHQTRGRLFAPAGAVLVLIALFYMFRLIPPVPLSVQFAGIYHAVEKSPEGYVLKTPRPPWYRFWRKQSRPFLARPGDSIMYFVRIYAPSRFRHNVRIRWLYRQNGKYVTSDVMPLSVIGGRMAGFRGYAGKANYSPGKWRVVAETDDGRAIGSVSFLVEPDGSVHEREWLVLRDRS